MNFGSKLLNWVSATADSKKSGWKCYLFAALVQIILFVVSAMIDGESEALWTILHVSGAFIMAVLGGRGPGYLGGILAALSVDFLYIRPRWEILGSPAGVVFFVFTLFIINATLFIVGLMQKATKDALHSKRLADETAKSRENALTVIAHDLRQPVCTLLLQAKVVKCGMEKGVNVDAAAKLKKTVGTLKRMDRLIQDLLDSAKVDSDSLCLSKEEVNLWALTNSVVSDYMGQASQKSIQVGVNPPEHSLPPIEADKNRLIRVISNLVGNSLKFTPEGGRVEIDLGMPDPDHVQFRISNTGPRIPEEQIPNLFKRNWQETKTAHLGNGLGLYICQGIIKAHEGSIWYEPHAEMGASFCFRLPLAQAMSSSREIPPQTRAYG